MKTLFSLVFLMSVGFVTYSQVICYTYDAAGNRRVKVTGPCDAPSGLVAPPSNDVQAVLDTASSELPESVKPIPLATYEGMIVPNPANSMFEIRLNAEPQAGSRFELFDSEGRRVTEKPAQGTIVGFNVSDESNGVFYLYLICNGEVNGQWKVIKQ